jgi:hypothetical protein
MTTGGIRVQVAEEHVEDARHLITNRPDTTEG